MNQAEYTQKYSELTSKIGELQRERSALKDSYAKEVLEKHGYHIGDRIKDRYGDEYEITKVEPMGNFLWLHGKKIKIDGTPSLRETQIYGATLKVL